jgi:hypothetical protein
MLLETPADRLERMTDPPPLTRSDAWLLAALTEGPRRARALTLQEFVGAADWLNRLIPTFDEVSYGVQRLVAAGFVTVDGLTVQATAEAKRLRGTVRRSSLGGVLHAMEKAVGAPRYGEPEPPEDRSLGRWPALHEADLDRAIREHSARVERLARPILFAARVGNKLGEQLVRIRDRRRRR